jgi:hypothetical protein
MECIAKVVFQLTKGDETKPRIRLEFNQDIKITIGGLSSSNVGAENSHLGDVIVLLQERCDLLEIGFDLSEGFHG